MENRITQSRLYTFYRRHVGKDCFVQLHYETAQDLGQGWSDIEKERSATSLA